MHHISYEEAERVRAAIDADMAARAEAAAAGTPLVRSTSQIGDDIAAKIIGSIAF